MTYTINKSDGTKLVDVLDGTIDETTDLKLIGKNSTTFGEALNEDLVHLLENFSNSLPPSRPIIGQLWYNTSNSRLEVYTGNTTGWRASGAPIIQETDPLNAISGDFWINTRDRQLYFYDGSNNRVLAGPIWTASQGKTGFVAETLFDAYGNGRPVLQLFVNNSILGIYSAYEFIPSPDIDGFYLIEKGYTAVSRKYKSSEGALGSSTTITVATTSGLEEGMAVYVSAGTGAFYPGTLVSQIVSPTQFTISRSPMISLTGGKTVVVGTILSTTFNVAVNDSKKLLGVDGNNFVRTDVNSVMYGRLSVATNSGIKIGAVANVEIKIETSKLAIENTISNGDIAIRTKNPSSTTIDNIYISASTGKVTINGNLEVSTTLNVIGASTLASAKVSSLTSGRVLISGTAGLLQDNSKLTFDGTTLTVTSNLTVTGKMLTKPIPLSLTGTETNAAMQTNIVLILNDVANPSNYSDNQQALVHYQRINFSDSTITRYLKRYKITSSSWVFDQDLTSSV